ncbi:uncharacterized protein LOC122044883 [Zingiber officinale]|uniref:uncharacterized protein LOC122044883 n=1 Tax=Zingiber officinale TaxID=94328 RepID=UPI001C4BE7AA|nr:uncharacterized protein LOC122044883 [Zingiber officinale]
MQLSVRLDYRATNNEAEYGPLIAGLYAARHVGAAKVIIHSDSQLATQQLLGAFEISSSQLKLYAKAFEKLKANFQEVVIQKITLSDNQITDGEATRVTPFHLVYSGETVVLVEVGVESDWVQLYDDGNTERKLMEFDLVDEARDKAAVRLIAYRQRMKQNYNRRVIPRLFQVVDLVWKRIKQVGDVTKLEVL